MKHSSCGIISLVFLVVLGAPAIGELLVLAGALVVVHVVGAARTTEGCATARRKVRYGDWTPHIWAIHAPVILCNVVSSNVVNRPCVAGTVLQVAL